MKMIILGGGFVGQLLHTIWPTARIIDARPLPPGVANRQLGPQYLWKPIPGLLCERFRVLTYVDNGLPDERSIRLYKEKVGKSQDNSDWRSQFQHEMAGYDVTLPPSRVEYNRVITIIDRTRQMLYLADGAQWSYDVLINTIPLPTLMSLCGMTGHKDLQHRPIHIQVTASLQVLLDRTMFVNYISNPATPIYRQTFRGGQQHTESLEPLPNSVRISPGKIYDHRYVSQWLAMLAASGIYCFGRFATWSPDELAHESYDHARSLAEQL